jgi:hypothetical protein
VEFVRLDRLPALETTREQLDSLDGIAQPFFVCALREARPVEIGRGQERDCLLADVGVTCRDELVKAGRVPRAPSGDPAG